MIEDGTQLPPHDLEAEQAVIGSLLLERDAIAAVADWLREDAFWHGANAVIYRAMKALWAKRRPCDLITLTDTLTALGLMDDAGGYGYINQCLSAVPTAVHVVYYAEIVMRHAKRRAVIDAAAQVMGAAWRHDEFDLDALTETIHAAGKRFTPPADDAELATMEGAVAYVRERAEKRWRGELHELILPTGIADIDRKLMGGFRAGSLIINAASSGMGKALALNTPIPTPSGWTTMADLRVGDAVLGADGQPTNVTNATDVMIGHDCFDVTFSDGSIIKADADHRWLTYSYAARRSLANSRRPTNRTHPSSIDQRHKHIPPSVVTTKEISDTLLHGSANWRNHAVQVAAPLALPQADLPIPPYTLGAWLGDGSSAGATLYTADAEVLDEIRSEGIEVGPPRFCNAGLARSYRIGPLRGHTNVLRQELQALSLLDNKHIPAIYLRGSEPQRRALLAGLMDTDGHGGTGTGPCEFESTREPLARQVLELVISLGIKASCRKHQTAIDGRDCGPSWRVTFTPDQPVFRLERKNRHCKFARGMTSKWRYITAVTPSPSVPVRCIQVDNADHLYLAGETMIPTHNTSWALQLAAYAAEFKFNVLFIELEMDRESLVNRMVAARAGVPFHVPYNTGIGDAADRDRYLEASEWVANLPITIKTDITTTDQIAAYLQRQKAPIDFVVVDHLGYLTDPNVPESQGKESQLNSITKALKRIAVTNEIPVLALAELNRSVEIKAPFKPNGEHLKYSQSILYNCDYLFFLYRRKYYVEHQKLSPEPLEDFEHISSHRHKVELNMMKNRNGAVGSTDIAWEPSSMSFHAIRVSA